MKRVLKWIGWLILALFTALALFAAFNWTMVRNMASAGGKSNTETDHLVASQTVEGCELRPLPKSTTKPISDQAFGQMQAFSDKHKGLGLLVLHDGRLVYERYAKGVAGDTRTQTFSMNKSVTAMMIGIALADGKIKSIDTPLGVALPELNADGATIATRPVRGGITLRHLLTMASGLHNPSMANGEWAAMSIKIGRAHV